MKLAGLTLLFTLTFVGSPFVTSPFAGFSEDQLPIPQIDPPIQPAGYAFSIWGLIYGWLLVSAIFGVWNRLDDAGWAAMRRPLALSLALGTPWLWVAGQSPIAATILIFAMALPAIAALLARARERPLAGTNTSGDLCRLAHRSLFRVAGHDVGWLWYIDEPNRLGLCRNHRRARTRFGGAKEAGGRARLWPYPHLGEHRDHRCQRSKCCLGARSGRNRADRRALVHPTPIRESSPLGS